MRYNKLKAFTLAEVMVLLLTLSILLAAFAPVFTRRYQNVSTDDVWSFVTADDNYNAYFDVPNKIYVNSAFIGLNPTSADDVSTLTKDGSINNNVVYSKLIIAASGGIGGAKTPQNQMQFRYSGSSSEGNIVGTLFAGNGNMLVGGPYRNIKNDATYNTAFGYNSMTDIKTADFNTAVGTNSLAAISDGSSNTAIGYSAGENLVSGKFNTLVGSEAGRDMKASSIYNTAIGYNAGYSVSGNGNTAVGFRALEKAAKDGNTAVGAYSLNLATGSYNTGLGAASLAFLGKGDYNTAVGSRSCLFLGQDSSEYSKITCIGAGSGISNGVKFPLGPDRVFIGSYPINFSKNNNGGTKPTAVVEVHNSVQGPNNELLPVPNGEESVIINGNLVVRGSLYMEAPVYRQVQALGLGEKDIVNDPSYAPKGLMLFKLFKQYPSNFYVLAGWDGSDRNASSYSNCGGCKARGFQDVRENCICTAVGPGYNGYTHYYSGTKEEHQKVRYSSTSYDWYSKTEKNGKIDPSNSILKTGCDNNKDKYNAQYTDGSDNKIIKLSHAPGGYNMSASSIDIEKPKNYNDEADNNYGTRETDKPLAHICLQGEIHGCCPDLSGNNNVSPCTTTSDIRLKNVGEKFTAGLDEIKKLKVYNFTFKNDVNKIPQVGVIAQELKVIFPQAVSKNAQGYYTIRWDEMFYAAINAVKTLNAKINALADKIATDKERVATLKRDNAKMYVQLENLAKELDTLEAKKK